MPIRLMENFRAIFYAPYYATHALGFFKREGVDVELLTSDAPGDAVPKLIDGSIDVTWGGPMRVMKARDQDSSSPLKCFGEVVSRDPFFLIGRRELAPFRLPDLARLRFATVSEVPTPWLCLQHDLRLAGVDPEPLKRVTGRTMERNYAALRAGDIDIMQAFEPYVSRAAQDNAGVVLYAANARGLTVYTAYIAAQSVVETKRQAIAAMVRATAKMEQWLYSHPAEELADATASFFPQVPRDLLVSSLGRYRDAGLWAREPSMSREGFDRLALSLHSGGFITRLASYDACVETSLNGIR